MRKSTASLWWLPNIGLSIIKDYEIVENKTVETQIHSLKGIVSATTLSASPTTEPMHTLFFHTVDKALGLVPLPLLQ